VALAARYRFIFPPLSVSVFACSFHFECLCRALSILNSTWTWTLLPCDDDADQRGPSSLPLSALTSALDRSFFLFPRNTSLSSPPPTHPMSLACLDTCKSVHPCYVLLNSMCSHPRDTQPALSSAITKLCKCCLICSHKMSHTYVATALCP